VCQTCTKLFNSVLWSSVLWSVCVHLYLHYIYGTIRVWHSSSLATHDRTSSSHGQQADWLVGWQPADSPSLEWNFQIPSHSWLAGAWQPAVCLPAYACRQPAASMPACLPATQSACLLHELINMKVGRWLLLLPILLTNSLILHGIHWETLRKVWTAIRKPSPGILS